MKDIYSDQREASKQKKADNRDASALHLVAKDVHYVTNNGGAHLIVEGSKGKIDFWPGTGRWIARSGEKGFGVMNLISGIKGGVI